MKRVVFLTVVLGLPAFGDLVIESTLKSESRGGAKHTSYTLTLQGKKFHVAPDKGPGTPKIAMHSKGEGTLACLELKKMCMKVNHFFPYSMTSAMEGGRKYRVQKIDIKSLGTASKVAGKECTNYQVTRDTASDWEGGSLRQHSVETTCYSKAAAKMLPEEFVQESRRQALATADSPEVAKELENEIALGFPLRRKTTMTEETKTAQGARSGGSSNEMDIVSMTAKPVDAALFETPAGYQVVDLAQLKRSGNTPATARPIPPQVLEKLRKLSPEQKAKLPPPILEQLNKLDGGTHEAGRARQAKERRP